MTKSEASQKSNLTNWGIIGLPAMRPHPKLGKKLQLFGQFVGDWDIVKLTFPLTDKSETKRTGEVHFNWILDGKAIQDVWGRIDDSTGKFIPVGTTIRFYDEKLEAWRSIWISPLQRDARRFIGRKIGSEIVLSEENRGLRTERWIFYDIKDNSFRWRAMRRTKPKGPWRSVEEMTLERS